MPETVQIQDVSYSNEIENTIFAECLDCHTRVPFNVKQTRCPDCGSQWREARYTTEELGSAYADIVSARSFDNMWRYRELLPVRNYNRSLSLGEGATPLTHAQNLGMMLGLPHLYIKDERQGPTNSFKDRQAAVGIAALKEAGITEMVLASTGNVAIAFSAFASRAGIKLWTFLTSLVPPEKMREVALYGTQVVKVTSTYDQAKKLAASFADQRGLYLECGSRSIPSVEAMKTIAYEIAEQVTDLFGRPKGRMEQNVSAPWCAPDWYFQSVSGGLGPQGVQKGFLEMQAMGLINRVPSVACVQVEGCAPMAHAWRQGLEVAEPIRSPRTHIATLATGDPGRTYTLLRHRMMEGSGGTFESVSDEETFRTMHILAKMEGISVEPAAAVAFAGVIKMARRGEIKPDEVVVVNCTGHTMPIEKGILGDGWARNVVVSREDARLASSPEEGLLSALSRVTSDRYSRILIVDDTPDARRLVRRILQSQGDYNLLEAGDGQEALRLARQELPDLVILDLMMPEIDGFAVLDSLKTDPTTETIPVIVVTAKELTRYEKERLQGRIHSLMQKGEFMSDELLDEVRSLVK